MENKYYLTANDVAELLKIGKEQARRLVKELQEKAKKDGYFIPESKSYLVPTKYFKKEIKLWKE